MMKKLKDFAEGALVEFVLDPLMGFFTLGCLLLLVTAFLA
jgi:hypothetical protein